MIDLLLPRSCRTMPSPCLLGRLHNACHSKYVCYHSCHPKYACLPRMPATSTEAKRRPLPLLQTPALLSPALASPAQALGAIEGVSRGLADRALPAVGVAVASAAGSSESLLGQPARRRAGMRCCVARCLQQPGPSARCLQGVADGPVVPIFPIFVQPILHTYHVSLS